MTFTISRGTLGLFALTLAAAPYAFAADDTGWYGGVSAGRARAKIDDARITTGLIGSGFTSSTITDDDRATGFKAFAGYQFNRNLALEGGYFDLGTFSYDATTVPTGTLHGQARFNGLNLDTVGILPLTDRLSLLARVGVNYAQARDQFSGTGAVNVLNSSPSKRQANLKVGLGMQYAFSDALAMRVEAERYRVNDAVGNRGDVDLFSVGLLYRFGDRSPTPVARTAAPEPIAPQPVAAVEPPPPVAPVMPKRVSFAADSLFGFNQAIISAQGKTALATFAGDVKASKVDRIKVTGHTDRLGGHAYNLKLSARRADAVKNELVTAGGLDATKIDAVGVDGADPVTKPGECVGNRPTKKLIACLQPDRRVDVEMTGTQ